MGSAKESIKFTGLHYGERGQWLKWRHMSGFLPPTELQWVSYAFSLTESQTQIRVPRDGSVVFAAPSLWAALVYTCLKTSWVSQGRCHGSLLALQWLLPYLLLWVGKGGRKNMPHLWLCNPGQAASPLCGLAATLLNGNNTVKRLRANEHALEIGECPRWNLLPWRADAICEHQSHRWSSQEHPARPSPILHAPVSVRKGWRSPVGTDRAEELCSLLQEAHQATLREVPTRAHSVLIRWQGVVRDCRLLQHIGGNIL